jgi:hypothetical protein
MEHLLADPAEARRLGANAREVARARFGMDRFIRDWNAAFALAAGRRLDGQTASAAPRTAVAGR